MKHKVSVEYSKRGWRQFVRLNRTLGARLLQGFTICSELADYMAFQEESGTAMDEACLELRYDGGVYLLLKRVQGTWLITDIWLEDEPLAFTPVYFWTRFKRGCSYLLGQILIGWQQLLMCSGESGALSV